MEELTGRVIGGRYRVESFEGHGGMANVYKVWDQQRAAYLAMKVLHSDLAEDRVFLRRFKREGQMLERLQLGHPIDDLNPVVTAAEMVACQQAAREVHVDPKVRHYILDIIQATREHDDIHLGGSPRASLALFRTAQALAAVQGRSYALPDDVKRMALPVLGHRLILRPESRLRRAHMRPAVRALQAIAVPARRWPRPPP